MFVLLLLIVSKIYSPKDSKRSLNFFSQEDIESENHNLSNDLNGVLPLSQTSVVSFNLDDNDENQVRFFIVNTIYFIAVFLYYTFCGNSY